MPARPCLLLPRAVSSVGLACPHMVSSLLALVADSCLTGNNGDQSLPAAAEAVPKRILDLMNVEGLTRENVASHLQVSCSICLLAMWKFSTLLCVYVC